MNACDMLRLGATVSECGRSTDARLWSRATLCSKLDPSSKSTFFFDYRRHKVFYFKRIKLIFRQRESRWMQDEQDISFHFNMVLIKYHHKSCVVFDIMLIERNMAIF